jgi:DNA polymerase-3 subunit beta
MHFTVENEALANALALVKGCVPPKTTIPILAHIAVDARDGHVTVRSTNLDRECEVRIPAEAASAGQAALPGEVLVGLVRRLPKGGQSTLKLGDGRCKVISNASNYDLRALPFADFPLAKPSEDSATVFKIGADDLRQLIQSTSYALCKSIVKAYYGGVYLHVAGGKLKMVATDDHRLALKAVDLPKGAASMPGIVIPTDAAREILSLLEGFEDDVELAVGVNLLEMRRPDLRFATLLIGCQYPPYEKVVPKPNGVAATFRPCAVAEAAKRASVVYLGETNLHRKTPVARVSVADGRIKLEAGNPGDEQALEVVEAEAAHHDLSFNVHAEYLTEMLAVWPDTVAIGVQQAMPGAPILFAAEERPDMIHVIMPQISK